MKLKRFLAPLAGVLLALALCVGVHAAEVFIHGFFRYTVEDQSVTITAYTGRETEVTVPAMIGGNPVNTIAAGAFANSGSVRTVKLPDTVTTVQEGAFAEGQTVEFNSNPSPRPDPAPAEPTPAGPDNGSGSVWGGEGDPMPEQPPVTPTEPADAAPAEQPPRQPNPNPVVVVSDQRLTVDGAEKAIDHYNIDGYNYFKLRDLACLLNGTKNSFDVGYDETARRIELRTGKRYTPLATDLVIGKDMSATATVSSQTLTVDGKKVSLTAYNIGGYNFFMLRDLAPWLGFGVDYDETTRTAMILTK